MPQNGETEDFSLAAMGEVLIIGAVIGVFVSQRLGLMVMLASPVFYLFNLGWLVWLRISRQETSNFALQLMMPGIFFWLAGLLFLPQLESSHYFGLHVLQIWAGLLFLLILLLNRCYYYSPSR